MRKIFAAVIAVALLFSAALAIEIDLEKLTFDELTAMKTTIGNEQMKRPEWKKVIVQPGVYRIGTDIAPGRYTVRYKSGYLTMIDIGDTLSDSGNVVSYTGDHTFAVLSEAKGESVAVTWNFPEGYYFSTTAVVELYRPRSSTLSFE